MTTMEQVSREILKMDRSLTKDSKEFEAAGVLLAGTVVGAKQRAIERFTGWSREKVWPIFKRLESAGIFRKGVVHHGGWFDPDDGGIAFWCDVCVAMGLMKRAPVTTKKPTSKKTGAKR